MTREEMIKRSWKPYMGIDYKHPRMDEPIQCMLISINFDDEVMELQPYDDNYYAQSFFSAIQNCSIPKRLKVVALNGEKVTDEIGQALAKKLENFKTKNPSQ